MKGDDTRTTDITQQLEMLNKQRKAFERVVQMASKMGEDVSALLPVARLFDEEQKRIMQSLGGKALLPSSATQPAAPQIGQPTLPNL